MSEITSSQHVTHIREGFTPSQPLEDSLNAFLERPTTDFRFYTEAQRHVSSERYHSSDYQQYVRSAERGLRRLGSRTLGLSSNVSVRADEYGLTLLFKVIEQDQPDLAKLTDILNYFEREDGSSKEIYLRIARSSLARSAEQRRLAGARLLNRLQHPSAEKQMRIGNPQLVSRDIRPEPLSLGDLPQVPRPLHEERNDQ